MKNTNLILDRVLGDIKPEKDYEIEIFKKIDGIIKKINANKLGAKAILGGSGSKGTWLKTFDADIFVLFDYRKYKDKSDRLSEFLEKILKSKFKGLKRLHGSRDYFQLKDKNFTFEIIPILKIKNANQAMNITDISPLHSNWVRKHKKLANQMKLTKQFCAAQKIYGAESYIRGFSGYVCEILTAYYGSFTKLMWNAVKWKSKTVIDIQKHYKNQDVFKIVNTSKLISPLIVIDPVQKGRNAAAALSDEKFDIFTKAAKRFIKSPSPVFFTKKNIEISYSKKLKKKVLIKIEVIPLNGKIDIVGNRLLKIYESLIKEIEKNDFKIIKSDWEWNRRGKATLYFIFDKKSLSNTRKVQGPPLGMKDHVANFKKVHKSTVKSRGKIVAFDKRKFIQPAKLLSTLIKNPYIKERCSSIRCRL